MVWFLPVTSAQYAILRQSGERHYREPAPGFNVQVNGEGGLPREYHGPHTKLMSIFCFEYDNVPAVSQRGVRHLLYILLVVGLVVWPREHDLSRVEVHQSSHKSVTPDHPMLLQQLV
jgi:hypothetical protein